jgi:RNA polymerase sigma-70 factor (ECF subfamily)
VEDAVSPDPFDTLVTTYHGEIYIYLRRITGNVADAGDLSQATFIRALETRRSPEHVASPRPWLFAIATDLFRSQLRSRRRRARRSIQEDGDTRRNGEEPHALAVAITHLPAEQRIALVLRKLHDFDYEGIGRMLGCSSQSARRRVMRGFREVARMRSVRPAVRSVTMPATPGAPAGS